MKGEEGASKQKKSTPETGAGFRPDSAVSFWWFLDKFFPKIASSSLPASQGV